MVTPIAIRQPTVVAGENRIPAALEPPPGPPTSGPAASVAAEPDGTLPAAAGATAVARGPGDVAGSAPAIAGTATATLASDARAAAVL